MRNMGGLKAMPITLQRCYCFFSNFEFHYSQVFSKDEILLVAFHHNIPLWVVASVAL
jgi:NADH-quinone oxidoreductase subunit L